MTYVEKEKEGKQGKMLVPVVHNLVFLQKNESRKATLAMLKSAMFLSACFATKKQSIPVDTDKQMTEFRILCDPDFKDTLYITHEEGEAKPARTSRIIHGPLPG